MPKYISSLAGVAGGLACFALLQSVILDHGPATRADKTPANTNMRSDFDDTKIAGRDLTFETALCTQSSCPIP